MADAWALEPRLPEEVDSKDCDETCPLCGSPNFKDGYCSVCGYDVDDEETGPIQIDDSEADLIEDEEELIEDEDELVEDEDALVDDASNESADSGSDRNDSERDADTTDQTPEEEEDPELADEDGDGDLDPSEEDLVEDELVEDTDSELVYDEDGVMVFEEGGHYLWFIDGTDETGVAETLDDAVAEARDMLGDDTVEGSVDEALDSMRMWASRTATRHFTRAEIEELEDEIEGTTLANASRLRY